MNERISTRVDNAGGYVHAGNGDFNITVGADLQDSDRRPFRSMADDQLGRLQWVLVAPPGMGEARHKLADTGTVILDGPPGSGRTATARVLLHEYQHDTGVFHEILPDDEDELSLSNPALVGAGDRLLLDLSSADTNRWAAARAELSSLRKTVHEQQAHLVVVMPHENALEADLQYYRVEVERPKGLQVFRRHLRLHGLPYEQNLQSDPIVTKCASDEVPIREIADFADRVRRAREAARPDEGFTQWCKAAQAAHNDRRAEIATRMTEWREGPQRALLLTVAMLHDAHADVIHQAAELLLRTLKAPPDDLPLLQRKDLAERLTEISAVARPDGHVRFTELDYDAAVRTHFWDHMPDLRPHLNTWTARSVGLPDLHDSRTMRDGLVARLRRFAAIWARAIFPVTATS
ncbi:hypothetical protein ABT329_37870, partial [Streptomyces minutiscleroticus]